MKTKILLALLMSFFSAVVYSQSADSGIHVGDVFTLGEVPDNKYTSIDFPRTNFIIKKGGIANYKNMIGEKVEVTAIKEKKDGTAVATIKLASEKFFFNSHKYVTADINEALRKKELLRIN